VLHISRHANETVLQLELPGLRNSRAAKVREIFDLGDRFLFVASDRISAFDVIMPNGIPRKGEVLTQISYFWFAQTQSFQPHHLISKAGDPCLRISSRSPITGASQHDCEKGQAFGHRMRRARLSGRLGLEGIQGAAKCLRHQVARGLKDSSELPEPLFTPATKAETGHDENISFEEAARIIGADIAEHVRAASLKIYNFARDYARKRGIIIADTKFEFGELTANSFSSMKCSPRFLALWPADQYQPGKSQPSFDKQFVRDYLETLDWNKTPPGRCCAGCCR